MITPSFVVGSTNPVKLRAVQNVLARALPGASVLAVAVESGVPDQPFGDEQTIRGAAARAEAARAVLNADFGVGIEGGVVELPDGGMRTCAWAVVVDREGNRGTGGSLAMALPPVVAAAIRDGAELGVAMDAITGGHDTKRGAGAVGILTAGLMDRQAAYEALVTYALAPFLTPAFWTAGPGRMPNDAGAGTPA